MILILLTGIVLAFIVMAALAYVIKRIRSNESLPATAEWISELETDRYRPMLRLLADDDLNFLRSQPGFTPAMAKRLRAQRIRLFRDYLGNLENDFNRVCSLLKVILVQSNEDREDLAGLILRNQITFVLGMVRIRASIMLYSLGICSIDVSDLLKLFNGLRVEAHALIPCAIAGAA